MHCAAISPRSAPWQGAASRSTPWSRPTPTVTVPCQWPSPSRPRERTGSAWPRSTRRWRFEPAGSASRSGAVPHPGRPCRGGGPPARDGVGRGPGAVSGPPGGMEATDTAAEPLDVELEVETGLGRDGFAPEAVAAAASAVAHAPTNQAGRAVDPPPGERGSGPDPASNWRGSMPPRPACAKPGCPSRHAMSRPVAGSSRAWGPSTASGRGSRSTGSCPTSSRGVP